MKIDVENEDTLHLVERQPQPSTGSSSGEATSNNGMRGSKRNYILLWFYLWCWSVHLQEVSQVWFSLPFFFSGFRTGFCWWVTPTHWANCSEYCIWELKCWGSWWSCYARSKSGMSVFVMHCLPTKTWWNFVCCILHVNSLVFSAF